MANKPKQPKLSIYAPVRLGTKLIDRRLSTRGIVFGTVSQVAQQYGVKMDQVGNVIKFSAPQLRIQMFLEKLHFAGVTYSERPPKKPKQK